MSRARSKRTPGLKDDIAPTVTPRLRFPEFWKTQTGWPMVELGQVVDTANLPEMYLDDDELDRFDLKAGDVLVCEGGEPGQSAVWDGRIPDLKFQKAIHRVRFKPHFNQSFWSFISNRSLVRRRSRCFLQARASST